MILRTGASGADTLTGTPADEQILGDPPGTVPGPGNLIAAGGGHDLVFAGYGADTVAGGAGNDTIYGSGTTSAPGGAAAFLARDDLADRLDGGAGDDVILGAGGDDTINGGLGDDLLHGDWGSDRLTGAAGDDTLHGGLGADRLVGGAGNDIFAFGMVAAPGAFGFEAGSGAGRDAVLDFTPGEDKLRFEAISPAAVTWRVWSEGTGIMVTVAAPDGTRGEIWLPGVAELTAADLIFG
ncbi:calcium-binding protein [Falsiroseomonas oryzae]|uniref:calcium-binding protein n=1 Tax=Falsiroseomonas oryzae TaxID=2766473 RepID=UPI0022EA1D59|nr:calcium-binding protein [Roseomonas sp. MO-31]